MLLKPNYNELLDIFKEVLTGIIKTIKIHLYL